MDWIIPNVISGLITAGILAILSPILSWIVSKVPRTQIAKQITVPRWVLIGMALLIIAQLLGLDNYAYKNHIKKYIPKKQFVSKTFRTEKIILDEKKFIDCKFYTCDLIYKGGNFKLKKNEFFNCPIVFSEAAKNTVEFITEFYHGGGKMYVEQIIKNIRKGKHYKYIQ